MSQKKLDKMMAEMNARLDEMEHRTQVEKKACELIAQGKDDEAVALINTLDDSVLEKRTDFSNFDEAQEAIYKELPTLVEKVFHAAFMNCTKGFQVTNDLDWKFIEPFITEMERVFQLSVKQQKAFLSGVWECDEQMSNSGGTRKERERNAK